MLYLPRQELGNQSLFVMLLFRRGKGQPASAEQNKQKEVDRATFCKKATTRSHDVEERHARLRLELLQGVGVDEGRGQVHVAVLDGPVQVHHLPGAMPCQAKPKQKRAGCGEWDVPDARQTRELEHAENNYTQPANETRSAER